MGKKKENEKKEKKRKKKKEKKREREKKELFITTNHNMRVCGVGPPFQTCTKQNLNDS